MCRSTESRRRATRHDGGLTDRLDHLFQHCADLGVIVEWTDLGTHRRGCVPRNHVIALNPRLIARQLVGTLAHEIGHVRFGDERSTPANERRAWEFGAAFLITPEEYRTAEERVGHDPRALALELEVTPRLIEGWRRWWLTRGRLLHHDAVDEFC